MRQALILAGSITLASAGFSMAPTALPAQLALPSGVRALPLPSLRPRADTARAQSRLPARFGLALVGGLTGLFAGAVLAADLELGADCDCDDPALGHAVSGAVVGVALGAAILAALPRATADCRYGARLWRGVAIASIGVAAGFIAPTDARLVTVPLGGIVGGALGTESCVWQRHD